MNKLNITRCPLCGSERLKPIMDCKDNYASGEVFGIMECADCGFRMTQGVPVEAEIGRYYETPDYISHSDTRKGLMNQVYHLVRGRMLERKASLVCRVSGLHRGSVLDIGTGTGYFAGAMKARGWQVSATEKNEHARQFAVKNFGVDVRGEEALGAYDAHSFDVVTMWHVLEHIEHVNEMASQWDRVLKADGTVVVAVPNCSSADAAMYGAGWAAYDVPRHLWHFVPATMEAFARKHGFEVVAERPMCFDAYYVSMLSEKYRGSKCYFLKGLWSGFRAGIRALGDKRRSSSIIYVLKRKKTSQAD
jgi:2-polyprenyl-3-methyl-5-hydroxy-6-metoxy-1,4-benzoquinol methylase